MGHKVHPKIHRTQVLFPWASRWVTKNKYADYLEQDLRVRKFLETKYKEAFIDSVFIERGVKNMTLTIFAARPGVIIGRGGQGLEELRKDIERKFLKMSLKVKLDIQEVREPSLSASIVAENICKDIENRIPFRRVIKQNIDKVMKSGGKGVKIKLAGRLNGVEIARTETLSSGKVPLITLRSNVDYINKTARTIYGVIGVKVWIYKGESFERIDKLAEKHDTSNKKRGAGQRGSGSRPGQRGTGPRPGQRGTGPRRDSSPKK